MKSTYEIGSQADEGWLGISKEHNSNCQSHQLIWFAVSDKWLSLIACWVIQVTSLIEYENLSLHEFDLQYKPQISYRKKWVLLNDVAFEE